jgi:two-component system cell cycle sensor histidine kinase/response regulator CckA
MKSRQGKFDKKDSTTPTTLTTMINATKPERSEEQLRQDAEVFRLFSENVNDLIAILDTQGRRLYNSPSYKTLLGDPKKLIGTDSFLEIHPDDRERIKQIFEETVATGIGQRTGFRFLLEGGDIRYIESQSSAIRGADGKIEKVLLVSREITERRLAEEALRESELRYRSLFDRMMDGVYRSTPEGRFVEINDSMVKMFGYSSKEEMMQVDIKKDLYFAPEDRESLFLDTEEEKVDIFRMKRKDGSEIWVEDHGQYVHDENGKIIFHEGILRDITERTRGNILQEAVYKISEATVISPNLDDLFIRVHKIIQKVMPADNFYIALYDEKEDLLSFPYFVDEVDLPAPPQKPGKGLTEYVLKTGKSLLCNEEMTEVLLREGKADIVGIPSPIWLGVPLKIEGKSIGVMTVQHYSNPNAYGGRELKMLEYVSSQIAKAIDRKQREKSLSESEARWRTLMESSPGLIHTIDRNGKILYINKPAPGFRRDEIIGSSIYDYVKPETATLLRQHIADVFDSVRTVSFELQAAGFSGGEAWYACTVGPITRDKKVDTAIMISIDITSRKRAEEKLNLSIEILSRISTLVLVADSQGKIIYISPSAKSILGYDPEELLDNGWWEITHTNMEERENEINSVIRFAKGDVPVSEKPYERMVKHRNGEPRWILWKDAKGPDELLIGVGHDITEKKSVEQERKNLETQLSQIQKMESIGTLAGGVAHDFNNILGIILGYSSMLQKFSSDPKKLSQSIDVITKSAKRGAALVQQILTFARKTDVQFESVDINNIIKELVRMINETFPKTIAIEINLDETLPPIVADQTQLHQALLNLCVNARDAMPHGGTLTFRTASIRGKELQQTFPDISEEQYLFVKISDNGVGMDEATKARIFEPFFTTKEKGKGTGLGLAVVYGDRKSVV